MMYHVRFKNNHYQAGYNFGQKLYQKQLLLENKIALFQTSKREAFMQACLPIYQKFYPEILEEIKGIADGLKLTHEDLYTFLLSMYCFEVENKCTCFAFHNGKETILARNSDFLVELEKTNMNCLYSLEHVYAFQGNTTAFVEMEDGMNEHGLAIGLTFIYPTIRKPGFNAGMIVRYLLEKCQTTKEAIDKLKSLPIASSQTLTIADRNGEVVVVECNPEQMAIIRPQHNESFVVTTNHFHASKLYPYNNFNIDNWKSEERYQTAYHTLKTHTNYSIDLARDILSGKYGFMCQYDRKTGADTVWSVIYCCQSKTIFRVEGNPSRKKFREDKR
ncbi:C45 family peptidase [Longibaculum muris]|uniref:C45 family peptidase n=1 Tax=Longibaculum muris TaxID=1796628 RepID=UPI00294292CB|nr:C45 family peptidase [Longibaculum muris]